MSHLIDPRAQHASRMFPRQPVDPVLTLSERQQQLLDLMSRPGPRPSIASVAVELGIAEQTIKNHLAAAYRRLHVHTLAQAVRVVLDRRLP